MTDDVAETARALGARDSTEAHAFAETATALSLAVQACPPPAGLKDRLISAVRASRAQPWKTWRDEAGPGADSIVRADGSGFEATSVEGVSVRRLFVDVAADRVTMLVRMAPETSYPRHRHGGTEECFVLEGDLRVGDEVLHAGDYQRVARSSVHGVQATAGGCLLLINSSLKDEILV